VTNLTDLEIFGPSANYSLLRERIKRGRPEDFDLFAFQKDNPQLFQLMGLIGPVDITSRAMFLNISKHENLFPWKETLLYLAPELRNFLDSHEVIYQSLYYLVLSWSDTIHKSNTFPKDTAIIALASFWLIEIPRLRDSKEIEPKLADHLEDILQNCLKILCAVVFNSDQSAAFQNPVFSKIFERLAFTEELLSCLPPGVRERAFALKGRDAGLPISSRKSRPILPPCAASPPYAYRIASKAQTRVQILHKRMSVAVAGCLITSLLMC